MLRDVLTPLLGDNPDARRGYGDAGGDLIKVENTL